VSTADLEDTGPFPAPQTDVHAVLTLDRIVHEPARLAILAVLQSAAEVDRVPGISSGSNWRI
jgi:hypothetical protein